MNHTLLDECSKIDGRKTWCVEPAEIQHDLDSYRTYYNLKRSQQGYRLMDRMAGQALRSASIISIEAQT